MEFWGVEVRAGEPLLVPVEDCIVVHLSQAALGELKKDKGTEPVVVFVEFDEKKYVLGTLSRDSIPQISLDVVFEKNFKLSHNWKHGSVYFCGYKADQGPAEESDEGFSDSEEDEDLTIPLQPSINGKVDVKADGSKPAVKSSAAHVKAPEKKVKIVDQQKEDKDSEDDDDSSVSGSDEDESDREMSISGDESDDGSEDEIDDDGDEEEPQPKGKKRTMPALQKTPIPAKKSKPSTPQNTDSKKGAHTATPHPAKKSGKAAANDKSPKSSGGQYSCKSCNKVCGSESGLEMHIKAKHRS